MKEYWKAVSNCSECPAMFKPNPIVFICSKLMKNVNPKEINKDCPLNDLGVVVHEETKEN